MLITSVSQAHIWSRVQRIAVSRTTNGTDDVTKLQLLSHSPDGPQRTSSTAPPRLRKRRRDRKPATIPLAVLAPYHGQTRPGAARAVPRRPTPKANGGRTATGGGPTSHAPGTRAPLPRPPRRVARRDACSVCDDRAGPSRSESPSPRHAARGLFYCRGEM